jgi:hypothetical protein
MKKILLGITLASLLVFASFAYAQPGMWGGGMMGGGGGYGMGPGMMGPGMMGPGMMGPGGYGGGYCPNCGYYQGPQGGYGMGPGMMGPGYGGGYGMGPGMMGQGMMGPGMMGQGWGGQQGFRPSEECQKYFDESAGLRKELHTKRFEYFEAVRNPKTTPETGAKLEKEMWDLQQKIYSKAPANCR